MRVIQLSLTTAIITSVCASMDAILTAIYASSNNVYLVFLLQLTHTYSLSVIFTLNIRHTWKRNLHSQSDPASSTHRPTVKITTLDPSQHGGARSVTDGIRVHVATKFEGDDHPHERESYVLKEVNLKETPFADVEKGPRSPH
ncbi:hypothetical protein BT69DRAFT_1347235 [Atractiella rhizophila]|nr:hypothetical protein BT69DRAFT_777688 [Atractiella rhizophila]KAH8927555.1 hypothetical protein BT69DRAFT_1347235 [Atractiella rhizophila]